jgi:hypothetical protein
MLLSGISQEKKDHVMHTHTHTARTQREEIKAREIVSSKFSLLISLVIVGGLRIFELFLRRRRRRESNSSES